MGWAVSQQHTSVTYDPLSASPHTHSTVPPRPLVQDTKSYEAKTQSQPRTWLVCHLYYTKLYTENMKNTTLHLISLTKCTVSVCVDAANLALQCVLEKEKLLVSLFLTLISLKWQHHQEERHFPWTLSLRCYHLQKKAQANSGKLINNLAAPFTDQRRRCFCVD